MLLEKERLAIIHQKLFYRDRGDYILAKRRNLKKEKAQRNQAYARQFRKRTSSRSYSRNNSFSNRNRNESDNNEQDSNSNENRNKEGNEARERSNTNR